MTTDELIKKKVTDQIYWDHRIDASDVSINVDSGQVTLQGKVPSYSAKEAALDDAWLVNGVSWVDNELEVEYEPSLTIPSDAQIQSNVLDTLRWNPNLASYKIDVLVSNGLITLEGTVDAFWKKVQAEREALGVLGVIDVVNKLAVAPTEEYADERIAEEIVNAMDRNRYVNSENVNVKVENGEVTLTGTVATWTAKAEAYDAAFYTLGVVDVHDGLMVTP